MTLGSVLPFVDKLQDFVTGLGGRRDRTTTQSYAPTITITDPELESMYRSDWVARKIVDIVPQDMVRAGRLWQATNDEITLIEATERKPTIRLWPKLKQALVRARLMGGSAIIVGIRGQSPSEPLDLESVGLDSLEYLNVVSRRRMTADEIELDPVAPWYGEPRMWRIPTREGNPVQVHPSRVIRFVGAPNEARDETERGGTDGLWGDSILQIVYEAVKNAASAQQHVAGLIPDARTDVIYVPNLGDLLNNPVEQRKLTTRFGLARDIKSMFNLLLLEGTGEGGTSARGEKWEHRQISFTQLPELIRQYLQIAAGAADIPITRFLSESPGGENATGESDFRNYYDHIGANQKLILQPAIQTLDEIIIRSALGGRPEKIHYVWAPLWALNETEKAEILAKKAKAARDLVGGGQDTPIVKTQAVSDAIVVALTEDGSLPGLEAAVAKHGDLSSVLPDSLLSPPKPAGDEAKKPTPVVDSAPRTLYVRRQLLNVNEFVRWASDQGIRDILPGDDLHVTVLFSKKEVDWLKMGEDYFGGPRGRLVVPAGGPRVVEQLGETATVLSFSSSALAWRHESMLRAGASSDYDEYVAHVTISHAPQTVDLGSVVPFRGELRFGPEIFEEVDLTWKEKFVGVS